MSSNTVFAYETTEAEGGKGYIHNILMRILRYVIYKPGYCVRTSLKSRTYPIHPFSHLTPTQNEICTVACIVTCIIYNSIMTLWGEGLPQCLFSSEVSVQYELERGLN